MGTFVYTALAAKSQPLSVDVDIDTVLLYEHKGFRNTGRLRRINVTADQPVLIHSLHTMDFKDCLSSLRWNLSPGVVVTFFEDHNGGGRQYQVWGSGEDRDTHDNDFGDCASAWSWHRSS